jgi:hypothetical protein
MGCVVYGIQLGWGCVVCGLVCSTSSGFSSGLLFSVGVFGLRWACVCVCACVGVCVRVPARARAHVCARACACVRACVRVCVRARAWRILVYLQERKNILTNVKECREVK